MKEKLSHNDDMLNGKRELFSLILFNDDINTFEHVIKSLVEVCGHDPVQAEQCAMLVHLKGSCEVKRGVPEVLSSMCRSLNSKGLRTQIG